VSYSRPASPPNLLVRAPAEALALPFNPAALLSCSATQVFTDFASCSGFFTLFLLRHKVFTLCCAYRKKALPPVHSALSVDRPESFSLSVSIWVHNKFSLIPRQLDFQFSPVQICGWLCKFAVIRRFFDRGTIIEDSG